MLIEVMRLTRVWPSCWTQLAFFHDNDEDDDDNDDEEDDDLVALLPWWWWWRWWQRWCCWPSCWAQLARIKKPPGLHLYSALWDWFYISYIYIYIHTNLCTYTYTYWYLHISHCINRLIYYLLHSRQPKVEGNHCLWDPKLGLCWHHSGVQVRAAGKEWFIMVDIWFTI